ncbi:hypothetical protein VN12_20625 [Pirellula sp. SH-Sr6A]|uniref:hypothetical protein n=1 Tax=Pirellula sp. SH-Sr6A TaxID=1632865 RepID=UPI00078EBEF2|nr:hypothetical protein [Pirellula sp. SH-Sr6A]AMV34542.1 hypothetical protein VN12_20625 [Pirellula sp. SH-Sr6A]
MSDSLDFAILQLARGCCPISSDEICVRSADAETIRHRCRVLAKSGFLRVQPFSLSIDEDTPSALQVLEITDAGVERLEALANSIRTRFDSCHNTIRNHILCGKQFKSNADFEKAFAKLYKAAGNSERVLVESISEEYRSGRLSDVEHHRLSDFVRGISHYVDVTDLRSFLPEDV